MTEIVVVSIGLPQCQETLRTALAMGADRAILVDTDVDVQPLAVAKVLQGHRRQGTARSSSSWASRRSITTATSRGRCSPRCSAGRRRRSFRRFAPAGDHADVTREVDGGLENLTIKLPAVVTADLRLNEPRYVTLPNIMKAKKKPLEVVKPDALGVDVAPRLTTLKVQEPPKRGAGVKLADVAALVDKLKNEAKVI